MYQLRPARARPAALSPPESGTASNDAFRDRHFRCLAIKVLPGEYCVTSRDIVLVTTLGSCVAACLRDPLGGVGGMNHFLLPEGGQADPASETARYGAYAMELLINDLISRGASRARLQAKLFGGANVNRALQRNSVGRRNAEFVEGYLQREGIPVLARDFGGTHARRVYFWQHSGRVMVQGLPFDDEPVVRTAEGFYIDKLHSEGVGGEVELFG